MRLIDIDDDRICYNGKYGEYENYNIPPDVINEALEVIEDNSCDWCEFDKDICVHIKRREK